MPKTHDYTEGGWGHDIIINKIIDKGKQLNVMGFGIGVKKNDYLILAHQSGETSRYQVETIEYFNDPRDMFKGVLKFAPRTHATPSKP